MGQERLLTPAQGGERLQVDERTVTRWLREAYLRGFELGKEWRIAPTDLEEFMECHANKAWQSSQAQAKHHKSE